MTNYKSKKMNRDYIKPFNALLNRKRNLNLIFGFLDVAKKDRDSSQILYDKKIYSLAIYHLQQSVEKIAKCYLLFFGEDYEEKIIKIGHHTPELFFEILNDMQIMEIVKTGVETKTKQDEELEKFRTMPKAKISLLSNNEITNFINLFKNYNLESINPDLISQVEIDKMIKGVIKVNPKFDKRAKVNIQEWLVDINNFKLIIPLAFITFSHFMSTRYPDQEIKPRQYDENLGIVKAFPELIEDLNKYINSVEKVLSKLKR